MSNNDAFEALSNLEMLAGSYSLGGRVLTDAMVWQLRYSRTLTLADTSNPNPNSLRFERLIDVLLLVAKRQSLAIENRNTGWYSKASQAS